jgi:hypothetical protein
MWSRKTKGFNMWLFTKVGFFSAVQCNVETPHESKVFPKLKAGAVATDFLSIRARVEGDLERLRGAYAPELGPTIELPGRDYPYRAYISKEKFAEAMVRASLDIDYGNFKDMITREFGRARHDLYAKVWSVMYGAASKLGRELGR